MSQFTRCTANIAAWNLDGFGATGIPTKRLDRQVEGLARLDAEVVVLLEVNPITAIENLRDGLRNKGVDYQVTILPQNRNLHIGVLAKDGVEVENPRFIEGSDLGDPNKRRALVVDVKIGRFDCVLVCVHLKAGREKSHQRTRDAQGKVIASFIRERLAQGREDIILVGDFNMIPGQDVSNFHHLGGDDMMDFISSWDLQERFSHILEAGRANLLDGFAIQRTFSGEYIRGSLRVFPMHWSMDIGRERYRNTVSDHLPFVASFKIDRSRD